MVADKLMTVQQSLNRISVRASQAQVLVTAKIQEHVVLICKAKVDVPG